MNDINAAPSSTEPAVTGEPLPPSDNPLTQEAGGAAAGESDAGTAATPPLSDSLLPAAVNAQTNSAAPLVDAPAVGGGIDAPSHLLLLDSMLADLERKIAAGIHLFAHEVTAARDHLAKLL
ncbi:hypothetical protein [Burkholderia pseudomultivorans]|uniref:hypothetical protein n=1 Tax=Burkholderia pseudomultivorans TaxID=1207504 RepID=UPI000A6C6670|nr:hypothetical protein [Burkholderia pseudomultivorans]